MSVLVADHDRWTRLDVCNMLDEAGFSVEQASNGVAALRIAESAQPQIVLLRHNLPEIGACDVLQALRNDRRTRNCAVLQVQRTDLADDPLESDGCLNLPCDPTELLARVVNALEARRGPIGSPMRRQLDSGESIRSVSAMARKGLPLVAAGAAQVTSRMRNAGRSRNCRLDSDIDPI